MPVPAVPVPAAASRAGLPALARRLAASYTVVMAVTLGYMLVVMPVTSSWPIKRVVSAGASARC